MYGQNMYGGKQSNYMLPYLKFIPTGPVKVVRKYIEERDKFVKKHN